jgi:hypothetical protein
MTNANTPLPLRILSRLASKPGIPASVRAMRAADPSARAEGHFRYTRNTGKVGRMGCVHCGQDGPSWCNEFRKTQRAIAWEVEHECVRMFDASPYYAEIAETVFPRYNPVRAFAAMIGGAS